MQRRLSIIVVVLNEARDIARLKSAIDHLAQPDNLVVETILVDGGSSDGTTAVAHDAGFTKVIVMPGASIPVCRNRGVAEACGDWIAFLDGDCEPATDWIDQATPFLESEPAVILGWPIAPPQPATWVQRAWHVHWSTKNYQPETLLGRTVVLREAFRLVTTRNMICTREAIRRCGPFDEKLVTGEDTDLVFRAYTQGVKVIGLPDLRVIHHGEPATLTAFFRQQLWHANRESYRRIREVTGGKVGGNAPRFTWLFLGVLITFAIGSAYVLSGRHLGLVLLLPLLSLIGALALRTALRARDRALILPIAVLYATYGLARVIDLIGLHRNKKSWKARG